MYSIETTNSNNENKELLTILDLYIKDLENDDNIENKIKIDNYNKVINFVKKSDKKIISGDLNIFGENIVTNINNLL